MFGGEPVKLVRLRLRLLWAFSQKPTPRFGRRNWPLAGYGGGQFLRPTSKATAELARSLGIPLLPEEENWPIEVAIDGADQVDANFSLIKGGGGALLREKIVAAAARRFIVIVDSGKCLSCLGHPMPVPVEVNRFGWRSTAQRIKELGWEGKIRKRNGEVFLTDGNHYILDVEIERIEDPAKVETQLNLIPGVVENGLFVGRTHTLIVGAANGVEIRQAP